MSDYLVSKLSNSELDSVEDKSFVNLSEAEAYAEKCSLYDDLHSYSVKTKIDDFEYDTLKIYNIGFHDI
jgi:hypothetical protein